MFYAKIKDIDFENGHVKLSEKDGKRLAPINDLTLRLIKLLLDARSEYTTEYLFFSMRADKGLSESGVRNMLKRRARRLEIKERIYPHLFRHTFSADFLRSGGDMYILSQILGHADPSFTKKFYAGFDIEPQKREHEKHTPLYQYMTLLEKVFTAFGQIVAGVEADEEGKAADDADEPEES